MSKAGMVGRQTPRELVVVLGRVINQMGTTETAAAEKLGVSASTVNQWMHGKCEPNTYNCRRIRAFVDEFIRNGTGDKEAIEEPTREPKYKGKRFMVMGTGYSKLWPVETQEVEAVSEASEDGWVAIVVVGGHLRRSIQASKLVNKKLCLKIEQVKLPQAELPQEGRMQQAANEVADMYAAMRSQQKQNNDLRREIDRLTGLLDMAEDSLLAAQNALRNARLNIQGAR